METRFFEFTQNNSGGYFDVDSDVTHRMIIEAVDADHATSIMEKLTENQSPSCGCCGERWSLYFYDEPRLGEYTVREYKYKDGFEGAEKRWFEKYGKLKLVSEPKPVEAGVSARVEGTVRVDNIEEYAQFVAIEWGDDFGSEFGDTRIVYLNGEKVDYFKR